MKREGETENKSEKVESAENVSVAIVACRKFCNSKSLVVEVTRPKMNKIAELAR